MSIKFDFESIRNRIQATLRASESWANILFYSTNQRLIDAVAEEIYYDMQYNEITTTETKWSLAKQLSSLLSQTQFFNYFPSRKIGSTGNLKLSTSSTFNASYALSIPIPKYTVVSNASGTTKFAVSEDTSLPSSETYVSIPIVQGIPKSITFTANGDEYEKFTVSNSSVENSTYDVYVNGVKWTEVSFIREAEAGALNYVIENAKDFSKLYICFGNGNYGKKLSSGDSIIFYYLETDGDKGNISSTGVVTQIESTLYDSNGNTVQCYCTNEESLTGGSTYEDIESIRVSAPRAYHAGDRAVSKEDYQYIVESYSFINKATVWGETETNEDAGNLPGTFIASEENVVHIACVTSDNGQLTPSQETTLRNALTEKKAPVDIVSFETVNFTYINFTINLYVSDKRYALSDVKSNVLNTLETDYSISNMDFKQALRFSDYVAKIDGVTGVDYHDTTISLYKYESFNSAYTASIALEMDDIKTSSVSVYVKTTTGTTWSKVAHDDGLGNFVADTGYTISASTIAYTDGAGSLIITSGLTESYSTYSIKVTYNIESTNIVPTKRYQIISYGTSTITASYE